MIRALIALALVLIAMPVSAVARPFEGRDRRAESPALHEVAPPQRHILLDNTTTTMTRLRFGRGTGETVHTHPFPLLIVQLTSGDVDLTVSDARARTARGWA